MTQVLLLNCPTAFKAKRSQLGDETSNPPLGLMYIASYLKKNGISVKVCDIWAEQLSIKKILKNIKSEKVKIVGLSATTASTKSAVQLATQIKTNFQKSVKIALGGAHISADPDFIKRYPVFDFGVIGEGEILFTQLVKKILGKEKVKGIYAASPIIKLDLLPFPDRSGIDKTNYYGASTESSSKKERNIITYTPIIGSRGCPFRCCFCSKPVHKTLYRARSPENIFEEMLSVYDLYKGFTFMDDTLTINREYTIKLCNLLINSGKKFHWTAMTRANCVDETMIKKMAKAGCHDLFFGVESGSERIRNTVIKKNVSDKEIFQAINWCRKYGIQTNLFLMVGFPEETKEDLEKTINFGPRSKADFIGVHITVPLPGSEIFDAAIKEGKLEKDIIDKYVEDKLGRTFKEDWPLYIPDGMTIEDLINAKKKVYRKFYLNIFWILRRLAFDFKNKQYFIQDFKMIKTGIYALIHGGTKYSVS